MIYLIWRILYDISCYLLFDQDKQRANNSKLKCYDLPYQCLSLELVFRYAKEISFT